MEKSLFELADADVTPGFDPNVKKMADSKMFKAAWNDGKVGKKWSLPQDYADDLEMIRTVQHILDNAVRILHRVEQRDYVNDTGTSANDSIMTAVDAIELARDDLDKAHLVIYSCAHQYRQNDTPAGTAEEYDDVVVDSNADWEYNDTANNVKDTLSDLKGY